MCLWWICRTGDTQKPIASLLLALDDLVYLRSQSSTKRRIENLLREIRNVFRYPLTD
jgi:hypothetical protein